MKILHIIPDFNNTSLYNLFIMSLSNFCHNKVYVPDVSKDGNYSYKIEFLNKNYDILNRLFFFKKQHDILKDITNRNEIKDYDYVHAHTLFSSGYIALCLFKKYKIPYIVAVRNTDVYFFFKYMLHLRKLGIEILKNAHKVVFISPCYKAFLEKNYISNKLIDNKSIFIPNGINNYFLLNRYKHKSPKGNYLNILYIGQITKNKNIQTTILACNFLIKKGYEISFTVVGDVLDKEIFYKLKNYDYISIFPYARKEKLIDYMRKSDIFIMPSYKETFGLVYIESMSQGLPVIYSKGQGIDGYFKQGEVGYAVESSSHIDIANKIIQIINNYEQISLNCYNLSLEFSWEHISKQYINNVYK